MALHLALHAPRAFERRAPFLVKALTFARQKHDAISDFKKSGQILGALDRVLPVTDTRITLPPPAPKPAPSQPAEPPREAHPALGRFPHNYKGRHYHY